MRPELEAKLFTDFPNLFQGRYKPITESLIPFGCECGDGWFGIIYNLSKKISELDPDAEATQVKEKYGGLRFYFTSQNDNYEKIFELIQDAEDESYKTCEDCGTKENASPNEHGWIKTLCPECREQNCQEREKRFEEMMSMGIKEWVEKQIKYNLSS